MSYREYMRQKEGRGFHEETTGERLRRKRPYHRLDAIAAATRSLASTESSCEAALWMHRDRVEKYTSEGYERIETPCSWMKWVGWTKRRVDNAQREVDRLCATGKPPRGHIVPPERRRPSRQADG